MSLRRRWSRPPCEPRRLEPTRGRCPVHRDTVPVQLCLPLLAEEVQVVREVDDRRPTAVSQDGVQVLCRRGDPGQQNRSEPLLFGLEQPRDQRGVGARIKRRGPTDSERAPVARSIAIVLRGHVVDVVPKP